MNSIRLMVALVMGLVGGLAGGVVAGEGGCVEPVVIGGGLFQFSTSPVVAIDVVGDFAYVIDIRRNLAVFDVGDLSSPINVGQISLAPNEIASFNWDVEVVDGLAYLVNWGGQFDLGGLKVFDVHDPASITQIGAFDTPGAMNIEVADAMAYIMNETSLLQIVALSDPELPELKGVYLAPGVVRGTEVIDGIAYLVCDGSGLVVVDVTNAAAPVMLGSFAMGGTSHDIEMVGSIAYVANEVDGLVMIDVVDPAMPVLIGSFAIPNGARYVSVSGDVAHVLSVPEFGGSSLLWSVGVGDPQSPALLGSYIEENPGMGAIKVRGETAFLGVGNAFDAGVMILDVTNSCGGDCPADLTGDGILDFFDVSAFVIAFQNGDPVADFNHDGFFDAFDVSIFLSTFFKGCP